MDKKKVTSWTSVVIITKDTWTQGSMGRKIAFSGMCVSFHGEWEKTESDTSTSETRAHDPTAGLRNVRAAIVLLATRYEKAF